ncbi:MAG TPA: twin-arginine translocation signal domain-containing protein, partial [Anaerolineales bacterium]|nr:twin-arginine translocation signal domain-containing protein [Anaerolineales bacterium]
MTITRRDFLKMSGMFAAWTALASCAPSELALTPTAPALTALPPLPLDDESLLVHTLRRFTFGPTPAMIEKAKRIGLSAFIEEQLFPESIPDDATD